MNVIYKSNLVSGLIYILQYPIWKSIAGYWNYIFKEFFFVIIYLVAVRLILSEILSVKIFNGKQGKL